MTRGPGAGRRFDIGAAAVTIGRDDQCDVQVAETLVSRRHARITWSGTEYIVEDLGSTNGTFVDGERVVGSRPLKSGDRLQLGQEVELAFQASVPAPLRETPVPPDIAPSPRSSAGSPQAHAPPPDSIPVQRQSFRWRRIWFWVLPLSGLLLILLIGGGVYYLLSDRDTELAGTATEQAVLPEPTTATPTPTPDPETDWREDCMGWDCTLHGVVYAGTAAPGNELAGARVSLDQHSWCSPSRGGGDRTGVDGTFDIEVYVHDTDTFVFNVDAEGYESARLVLSGFDCLYCYCPPIEFVLKSVQPEPTPIHAETLPLDWPVAPLTPEQIRAVRECDLETIVEQRYPESMAEEDLSTSYPPQTGCEWAALALAHADRAKGQPTSPAAHQAFTHAVTGNPGYALATPLFYRYLDAMPVVKPPAFAQQEITDVVIDYHWWGLGDPVEYSLEIRHANTEPVVTSAYTDSLAIDKPAVQALANALTDLLPVSTRFSLQPCMDNYPVWSVHLVFADKTEIEATTGSNVIFIGGPWFTEIDGQVYMQVSSAFAQAVGELIESLGLPLGEPAGMFCSMDTVFDKGFP